MKRRTAGMMFLGILFILFNVWELLRIVPAASAMLNPSGSRIVGGWSPLVALDYLFRVVTVVLGLTSAIGVLMLRQWARILVLVLSGVWMLQWLRVGFYELASIATPCALIWNGLVIWYFLRTSVKAQFGSSPE